MGHKSIIYIYIYISHNFHVCTDASLLVVGPMLAQNPIGKYDQPIVYAPRLLNKTKRTIVYALHKMRNFLLRFFFFNVHHMALIYLVNKPQLFGRIARWLLLFLKYEFIVVYEPSRTHVVANVLSKLPICSEPLGVLNQIIDASLFSIEPI